MIRSKEEMPQDVLDAADSLMMINRANPTAEEHENILLWINTANEHAEYLRRKSSSTITTTPLSPSSTIMESEIIIAMSKIPKTDKPKAPIVRNRRCFDVGTKERMPYWLYRFIKDNNGVGPKMIIEKTITATDLNSNNNRLSMPFNRIVDMDFLTEAEETIIEDHLNKRLDKVVDATIVDCELRRWDVNLRKWGMKNDNFIYNLVTGWKNVVEEIDLKENEGLRVWSFHSNGRLYFALVILPRREALV